MNFFTSLKFRQFSILYLLIYMQILTPLWATKPSGTAPEILSLPSGAGTIPGLPGAHLVSNTGAFEYDISFALPPGRAGITPPVRLEYNSNWGNSPFGIGWKLSFPNIYRKTNQGIPQYTMNGEPFLGELVLSFAGDIVFSKKDGKFWEYRFRYRNTFFQILYHCDRDFWEVWDENGTYFRFGYGKNSKISHREGTAEWLIDLLRDANGNELHFQYHEKDAQRYLHKILYCDLMNPYNEIVFEIEKRSDIFTSRSYGFPVTTSFRYSGMRTKLVGHAFGEYAFLYEKNKYAGLSLLTQVIRKKGTEQFPPVQLKYTYCMIPKQAKVKDLGALTQFELGRHNFVEVADFDSNGLTDLLVLSAGGQEIILNKGTHWEKLSEPDGKAWRLGLDKANVVLLDYTGDTKINLVCMALLDPVYYNTDGKSWYEEQPILSGTDGLCNIDFSSKDIKLADLTGDGRTDIISWDSRLGNQSYFLKNRGDGWKRISYPVGHCGIPSKPIQNFRFVDVDSDGIVDLVLYTATDKSYWPGLGSGNWDKPVELTLPELDTDEYERADFVDLTGDGLVELVVTRSKTISYWVGLGEGNFNPQENTILCPDGIPTNPTSYRWTDMDGNGMRDLFYFDDINKRYVYLSFSEGEKANLLHCIENGIGGEIKATYASSISLNTGGNTPFPMWVVSALQTNDGISLAQKTNFHYKESFYDIDEREFKGFREIKEHSVGNEHVPGLVSRKYYHTGFEVDKALWGRLEKSQLRDNSDTLLAEDRYHWEYVVKTRQILLKRLEHLEYAGSSTRSKIVEYEYDKYNNQISQYEYDRDDPNNPEYQRLLCQKYCKEDRFITNNVVNRLQNTSLYQGKQKLLENKPVYSYQFSYDVAFRLMEESVWKAQRGDPLNNNYIKITQYEYNPHGNIQFFSNMIGNTKYKYDKEGIFPIEVANALGQKIQVSYDYHQGTINEAKDINGISYEWAYDKLGRPQKSYVWDKNQKKVLLAKYNYDFGTCGNPGWVETQALLSPKEKKCRTTRTYFDGFLRTLQTRTQYFDNTYWVKNAVTLNCRGQEARVYHPYSEIGIEFRSPNEQPSVSLQYNARGNVIQKVHPDNTVEKTIYKPGFKEEADTEDTNPDSSHFATPNHFFYDCYDRLVKHQEILHEGKHIEHHYIYTVDDKLKTATHGILFLVGGMLENGIATTFEYDTRGLMLSQENPNTGKQEYEWRNNGLLQQRKEARGVVITYDYDLMGRIVSQTSNNNGKISYTYDQGQNALGRLSAAYTMRDGQNETTVSYEYDWLGRKTVEKVFLHNDRKSMEAVRSFDLQGNILSLQYQVGGFQAMTNGFSSTPVFNYDYSEEGFLQSISHTGLDKPIFKIKEWHPTGTWKNIAFGNGIIQERVFDKRNFLIENNSTLWNKQILQRNSLGDIQQITGFDAQIFRYDVRRQLAQYGEGNKLQHSVDYDAIRNIIKRDNNIFENQDQQVRKALGQTFSYDPSGYMGKIVFDQGIWNLTHNDFGCLTNISMPSKECAYMYDYTGRRIKKQVKEDPDKEKTSYFFSCLQNFERNPTLAQVAPELLFYQQDSLSTYHLPELEIAENYVSLHLYLGTTPVVRWEQNNGRQRLLYIHTDAFERPIRITQDKGDIVYEGTYDPYGKILSQKGNLQQPLRFSGQYCDEETGLFYNYHRYFSPELCRYLQPDSIGIVGGDNVYAYANNNPTKWQDTNGFGIIIVPRMPHSLNPNLGYDGDYSPSPSLSVNNSGSKAALHGFVTGAFASRDPRVKIAAFLVGAGLSLFDDHSTGRGMEPNPQPITNINPSTGNPTTNPWIDIDININSGNNYNYYNGSIPGEGSPYAPQYNNDRNYPDYGHHHYGQSHYHSDYGYQHNENRSHSREYGGSFKEAFREARSQGENTFHWNGGEYNTKLK